MRDLVLRITYQGNIYDLDVDSNIPLRLDISVVENSKLGKVFGVGSQTFNLPGTRRNNKFFEHAYKVGSIDVPGLYSYVDAVVLLDGDLVLQGKLQLTEVITDEFGYVGYKCNLIDDAVSFATQLEGKLIIDADFSDYNHVLDKENILQSWNADTGSALLSGSIFYPLCDYGTDDRIPYPLQPRIQIGGSGSIEGSMDNENTPITIQQFLPAIKARNLVDVIVAQAGFSYESNFIQGPDFEQLYVLPKSTEELGITGTTVVQNTFIASQSISDGQSWAQINNNGTFTSQLQYSVEISDEGSNYDNALWTYTAPIAGNYSFEANMTYEEVSPAGGSGFPTIEIQLLKNGVDIIADALAFFPIGAPTPFPSASLSTSTPGLIQLAANDEITAQVFISNENNQKLPAGQIYANALFSERNSFFSDIAPEEYGGAAVSMSQQFEVNTKSVDLYLGLVNQFNLITTPDPINPRKILIEPFDTWIELGRTKDWTEKVNQAKRMSIKHPISEQPRTIINKNADDADRFSKLSQDNDPNFQYGTRRTISNADITRGEKVIESIYGPTVLGSIIQSGSVDPDGTTNYNLASNTFIVPHLYKLDNKTQKSYIFKPRLGYKVTDLPVVNAEGGTIKIGSATSFLTASSYSTISNLSRIPVKPSNTDKNLHFDNQYIDLFPSSINQDEAETAYTTYWKNYIDSLYWTEARKITVDIYFTPEEYKDIRLNDKIIIKNQSYRINKISGFNLQQPDTAKVELIKFYPTRKPGVLLTPSASPAPPSPTPTATPSVSPGTPSSPTPTPTRTVTVTPSLTPSVSVGSGVQFSRTDSEASTTLACGSITSTTIYFTTSNPQNGDIAYRNSQLTNPDTGDGGVYGVAGVVGAPDFSVNISFSGVISNKTTCVT